MKEILVITIFLFGFIFFQETKLSGRYFVNYKNDKMQQDGYIDFNGDSFTMKHYNLLPYSGNIQYYKASALLQKKFDSDIIISVEAKEIGKDTIKFYVHDRKYTNNYLDISVNIGTFIKVK